MAALALVLAILALALALAAFARAAGQARRIEEASLESRRRLENLAAETGRSQENLRQIVAEIAAGTELSRDMVLEGRLWRDATPDEGRRMLEQGDLCLVDVRTPQETASGIIPGALLIPIDELGQRYREIPCDGRTTLVYCAGGARSAAACELLASKGYTGLVNLAGGFTSWSGPTARP